MRVVQINGGTVHQGEAIRFTLPPVRSGYADAQLDDCSTEVGGGGRTLRWMPGIELTLTARFSHDQDSLLGTAGFGFWNAPFGDPTLGRPAFPRAVWFFFGSPPSNLPLGIEQPGNGWFASTIDASTWKAKRWLPVAPAVLLLNQFSAIRRRIWPRIRADLGISFQRIEQDLRQWTQYRLQWRASGCSFEVNGLPLLRTPHTPSGPLGLVIWIDNQYLCLTIRGRLSWGVLTTRSAQWMELQELTLRRLERAPLEQKEAGAA